MLTQNCKLRIDSFKMGVGGEKEKTGEKKGLPLYILLYGRCLKFYQIESLTCREF